MNRYVIAGAVVISMLLIYFLLSGDGGGGDYLLEDYDNGKRVGKHQEMLDGPFP